MIVTSVRDFVEKYANMHGRCPLCKTRLDINECVEKIYMIYPTARE